MSRCKCPKPDVEPSDYCSPYFGDITTRMEERRCDLIGRQKHLRDKITTMERSIPALMAFSMWKAKEKCEDAPYCKVREIMKAFSPFPDQTEKLLMSLKKTVKELNGETAELHEKIIQADVKLEETGMELESLELANKEMGGSLNELEKEVQSYKTPSLHSIHSEDLLCLSKIRQLAEEELNLKNCIKELEQKEVVFKDHMDHLLMSREYKSVCGRRKMASCLQDLSCGQRMCCVPKKCLWRKPTGRRPKRMAGGEENDVARTDAVVSTSDHNLNDQGDQASKPEISEKKVEKKSSWMPNWWKGNNGTEAASSSKNEETTTLPGTENEIEKSAATEPPTSPSLEKELKEKKAIDDKAPKSRKTGYTTTSCKPCGYGVCPPPSSTKSPRHARKPCVDKYMLPCDIPCNKLFNAHSYKERSPRKAFCEIPRRAAAEHGIRKSCKPLMLPCDPSPCEMCPSMTCKDFLWPVGNNCRCNCRGKCSRGMSEAECNCSDAPLEPDEEYQPTAEQLADNSNSEDEYCECCSCGCEDSDASASCQCN